MLALASRGALGQVTCSSPGFTSPQTVSTNATRLNQLLSYWTSLGCDGAIVLANTGGPLTMRFSAAFTLNSRLILDGSARSHPLVLLPLEAGKRHFHLPNSPANLTAINIIFSDAFGVPGFSGASIFATNGAHLRLIRCTFRNTRSVTSALTRNGGAVRASDGGEVYLRGCTFVNNTIVNGGRAGGGAAIGITRASQVCWLATAAQFPVCITKASGVQVQRLTVGMIASQHLGPKRPGSV
jgi:hypothetical protein